MFVITRISSGSGSARTPTTSCCFAILRVKQAADAYRPGAEDERIEGVGVRDPEEPPDAALQEVY